MKIKSVPFSWIRRWGLRLDCGPYLSGAVDARMKMESSCLRAEKLRDLTNSIFHAGRESRRWVESEEFGVPFLSSSDILKADLNDLPLLSKIQVARTPGFLVRHTWTLITRSGTIGRMAYVRSDMDGMACSEHAMRVVPNQEKIPPGYLFAFLSCRFGVPMIVGGTYGSIIQSIEPEHIADLPVPRLSDAVEEAAHQLVEKAAEKRVLANRLLKQAMQEFIEFLGRPPGIGPDKWTAVSAKLLSKRCDAYYFSPKCIKARKWFDVSNCESKQLHEVAHVTMPGIFKRLYANDPQFGVPYITGGDVFELCPSTNRYLMKRVAEGYGLQVTRGMILIQEAGQLGGLIGKSVQVGSHLNGFAVSNNMVRVLPKDEADAGYVFTVLSSDPGVTLIAREAAGSSIPHLDAERIRNLVIPWASLHLRTRIGGYAIEARELRDQAIVHDHEAKTMVEKAIEEAA